MDDSSEESRPNVEASQECPVCHLIKPGTARVCDCGYSFETHLVGKAIGNLRKRNIVLPIIFGVITPSLAIFILEVFIGHYSPALSIADILSRRSTKN